MKTLNATLLASFPLVVLFCGCATSPAMRTPTTPDSLRAPADQVLVLRTRATGVQIYACSAGKDQPAHYEWVFKAPEAELMNARGRKVGSHYAGPTWESTDGSKVVGEVKARDAGPDPSAIPWLLLSAKSNSGSGVFSHVTSIQRLETSGGKAPASPCGVENAQQVVRVPYTAAYYFYTARQ